VLSRVLAFRPASVLGRLPPRSDACPLSLREVLAAAPEVKLPAVEAGSPDVIRAALVAAKVLHSTIGLSLPGGLEPEPWFQAVAETADEIAAALPLVLTAEVSLTGEDAVAVERGTREVWRLIEAGLTQVVVDAGGVSPEERGRVLAEVAAPLQERGLGFDCAIGLGEQGAGRRAIALLDDLARRGVPADAVSVRCPAATDAESARAQLGALDRLSEALHGVPVLRRGPVTPALLAAMPGARIRGCSDGGAAAAAAGQKGEVPQPGPEAADRRARWRDRAVAALGQAEAEQLEAQAFMTAADFIERLGAEQSAAAVAQGLARLSEDGA
jgi:hypothetical protein